MKKFVVETSISVIFSQSRKSKSTWKNKQLDKILLKDMIQAFNIPA